MISHQDGLQFVARITDPTGERRLEGEGVWDYIELLDNNPVIVEGYEVIRMWSASSQASGEQFIFVDGLSVTASANFDDVMATTEIEQIPGTLQATCP